MFSCRSARTYERGGTYTFFVSHTEDLSSSQDALVHWTYEADMFNPLSYCVLFCDSTLPLAYVSVTTLEGAGTRYVNARCPGERKSTIYGALVEFASKLWEFAIFA